MNIVQSINFLTIGRRVILIALNEFDHETLRNNEFQYFGTTENPFTAGTIMGIPVSVSQGGKSYAVEDTPNGPLIHFISP